jgi:hypothetical protein
MLAQEYKRMRLKTHVYVYIFPMLELTNKRMCVATAQMHHNMNVCADVKEMFALVN